MATARPRRGQPAITGCCELTPAVEDYLKAVFHMAAQEEPATTSAVARRLDVSPPSASTMLTKLRDEGLVERSPAGRVRLTEHGELHALGVVRRHRLVETFLARVVGLDWDEVHAEAEALEHVISPRLEARIDELLGFPARDPHGDPIPRPDGSHDETWGTPLADAAPGSRFRVDRVSDRSSEALRYLAELGVRPGVTLDVGERVPFGGARWVTVGGVRHALGGQLERLIHGSPLRGPVDPDDPAVAGGARASPAAPPPAGERS